MKEMNDKAPNEPVILKSIDRAIDVLEYLLTQEDEVSVSRISKELGFGKARYIARLRLSKIEDMSLRIRKRNVTSLDKGFLCMECARSTLLFQASCHIFNV